MNVKKLVDIMVQLAHQLLVSGLEVSRVEQWMVRFGKLYGMEEVEVFVITSSIIITVKDCRGETVTQTKRVRGGKTDFERVAKICALMETATGNPSELSAFETDMTKVVKGRAGGMREMLCYVGISFIFCLFFGGTLKEAVLAMISGGLMYVTMARAQKVVKNRFLVQLMTSFVCGMVATVFVRLGMVTTADYIVIGNIMLLIPGLALVNACGDLISEDWITGLLRLLEALVMTLAIGAGIALAYQVMGLS